MKKKLIIILLLMICFIGNIHGADKCLDANGNEVDCDSINDYNGGGSNQVGSGSSGDNHYPYGSLYAELVGLKVSLLDEHGNVKDSEIFTNFDVSSEAAYVNYYRVKETEPLINQGTTFNWVRFEQANNKPTPDTKPYYYTDVLPENWDIDDSSNTITFPNLHDYLSKNEYNVLKTILSYKSNGVEVISNKTPGDYIIVEPMAALYQGYMTPNFFMDPESKYNRVFGTAYELINEFIFDEDYPFCDGIDETRYAYCQNSGNPLRTWFIWSFGIHVFSGSGSVKETGDVCAKANSGGLFWQTIYVNENVKIGPYNFTNYTDQICEDEKINFTKRNACLADKTCGRGIGIFSYNEVFGIEYGVEIRTVVKNNTGIYNTSSELITSSPAIFKVYKGETCSGELVDEVTTVGGTANVNITSQGNYTICEVQKPGNYLENPDNDIKRITISKNETKTVYMPYERNCQSQLDAYRANGELTISKLFDLYKIYGQNGLLDFSGQNLENAACKVVSCDSELKLSNCLVASKSNNSFNENNLSCFDEKITTSLGELKGFCAESFQLYNLLDKNTFYGNSGNFLIKQSGEFIITYKKNQQGELEEELLKHNYIATSRGTKTCYTFGFVSNINNSLTPYTLYFGDNNNNNIADKLTSVYLNSDGAEVNGTPTSNGLIRYTYVNRYGYRLNTFYLEKLTGKYSANKTPLTEDNPVQGVLTKFNDVQSEGATQNFIPFKVNNKESKTCKYYTDPLIVADNKLELEFRLIDTKTPFYDRDTNTNWCDGADCSSDNALVTEVIKKSNNSLDSTGAGAKYTITLTPSDIKLIREYNKDNSYANYIIVAYTEDGVKKTKNGFLHDLETGKLNKYKLSDGINVIDKTYGNLTNKLEIKTNN